MLQVKPDVFTHTSDYFDLMLEYCEKLLKENRAYVDDTDPEVMKNEREKRAESKHRNNGKCFLVVVEIKSEFFQSNENLVSPTKNLLVSSQS